MQTDGQSEQKNETIEQEKETTAEERNTQREEREEENKDGGTSKATKENLALLCLGSLASGA
jgi:hypothetical protein